MMIAQEVLVHNRVGLELSPPHADYVITILVPVAAVNNLSIPSLGKDSFAEFSTIPQWETHDFNECSSHTYLVGRAELNCSDAWDTWYYS